MAGMTWLVGLALGASLAAALGALIEGRRARAMVRRCRRPGTPTTAADPRR